MAFAELPDIPGFTWRSMRVEDAAALAQFEQECGVHDGTTALRSTRKWREQLQENEAAARSVIAIDEYGIVAAAGRYFFQEEVDEIQAFTDGRVHPDFRGRSIGTRLLRWMERQATIEMIRLAPDKRLAHRLYFYDRAKDAIELFESLGYRRQFAEDKMSFDLSTRLPSFPLPAGFCMESLTTDNQADYYNVYRAAFRTRTDNLQDAEHWTYHFANLADRELLPACSLLVRDSGGRATAYAVCHGEGAREGWITQMGVVRKQRRQGIASGLLSEILLRFARAGFRRAVLSVNVDNRGAKITYEQVGFVWQSRMHVYRKQEGA